MELWRAAVIQLYEAGNSKVKIAKLLKMNNKFINRSLSSYNDTGLITDRRRPGRPRTCQLLSEQNKNKRLQRCKELVSRYKNHAHRDILFSDEKLFTVEQVLNFQNDRILATAKNTLPKSTFQVSRANMPASVMVWGGITFDGRTPLVFIPQGLKINQTVP
ncbi:hypothetical protein LOD99_9118 [Oopsacas minuta]|uniref:Transposase n=1 Tax=Oopsacas minuta TaxID=111878 RepID=A0AAV7JEK4_9METZ|nr:hypothetical protein LOD99_9118 [Oopsacas minuta]